MKISKELLSEVLGIGVYQSIRKDEYAYNDIKLNIINTELLYDYVNIYELAHKCKEWALVKGYIIKSEPYDYNEDSTFSGGYFYITRVNNMYSCPNCGANKSEVQAVIDACEWILKEIKK